METKVSHGIIIGGGTVGKCWALLFARVGLPVVIVEPDQKQRDSIAPWVTQTINDLKPLWEKRSDWVKDDIAPSFITTTSSLENALGLISRNTDGKNEASTIWIQECVPEKLDIKQNVYKDMELVLESKQNALTGSKLDVILASSTSAIPGTSFTQDLARKERAIVAHPINPPHLIPCVEVVPTKYTHPDVTASAMAFLKNQLGQAPVLVKKEIDSFVVNRLQGALLNEAWKLVANGVISADDLDKTIRDGLGLRYCFMGPFETIDLNAPNGVSDYVERYGGNMYMLAQQQAEAKKWEGPVVSEVNSERRNLLPISQMQDRILWRNKYLVEIMALKALKQKEDG